MSLVNNLHSPFTAKKKSTVFFFDFWNVSPHLETSLEIACRHLDRGDHCKIFSWGHIVPYTECYQSTHDNTPPREYFLLSQIKNVYKNNFDFTFDMPCNLDIETPSFNFRTINELLDYTWNDLPLGISVASSLISFYKSESLDLSKSPYKDYVYNSCLAYIHSYYWTECILKSQKPNLVYIFNGRYPCVNAVAECCKVHEIKLYYHERGSSDDKYLICSDPPHSTLGWHQRAKTHFIHSLNCGVSFQEIKDKSDNWFTSRRSSSAQAKIRADEYINLKLNGLTDYKKIITYFHSSNDEYAALSKDLLPPKYWESQITALLSLIVELNEQGTAYHLFIKLHPTVNIRPYELNLFAIFSKFKNTTVIFPEENICSYYLAEKSDLSIVYNSTIGIELAFLGLPVISLAPSLYSRLKILEEAWSHTRLNRLLNKHIVANNQGFKHSQLDKRREIGCILYGYYMATFGINYQYYMPQSSNSGSFKVKKKSSS